MLTHTRMNISNRKSSGPFRFLVEPVILGTVILLAVMILTPLKVDAIRCDYYKDPECRNNPFDVHNKNCTSQEVNCSPEEPFCHASFAVLLLNGINRTVLATKGCWSPQDSAPCKSGMQSYCTNTKPPVPNPAKPELGPTYFCCCDGPLCNQRLEINKAFGEADSILPYITMKQYKQYLLDGPKQIVAAESTGTITSDQNTASVPSLPSPIMQPEMRLSILRQRFRLLAQQAARVYRPCRFRGRRPFLCIARTKKLRLEHATANRGTAQNPSRNCSSRVALKRNQAKLRTKRI
ncbi:uncharacterized protein LOC129590260 isoform X2 [Paramacrobiotus metropolitanus]|uniref:uncharacterized protein LOC129590260 isoform X2 n=1 Tax=Paramacrobiotus metropolitanus TaxID=2943436 RepID=UPI002445E7B5|nr:uncharacterized protein LOC129590260 isoform X2 [Paramacrobiotus metropolitanus]